MENSGNKIKALLGPTNTGKTYLAIEEMLKHDSGIFGLPLRLLAREVYDKCVKKVGVNSVALITGEEKIIPGNAHYFICTVESMPLDKKVDFVAVDEIQMCGDKERGHISKLKDFELLPNVAEAIKLINESDYLAVLITNQPVIARGESSLENLKLKHNKLEFLISEKKAFLDRIYFCPHHPDRGFKGENLKFKIDCNCRKPKLGLFELAMNELNIDKKKSWIIGDSYRDIEAGNRLGIKTIYLSKEPLPKTIDEIKPSFIEKNLYEGVRRVLHNKN